MHTTVYVELAESVQKYFETNKSTLSVRAHKLSVFACCGPHHPLPLEYPTVTLRKYIC